MPTRRFCPRCRRLFDNFRSTAPLPAAEQSIAEVIGRGPAILLSHRVFHLNPYGRHNDYAHGFLYVPQRINDAFVRLVGNRDQAEILARNFHGEQMELTGCRLALRQLQRHAIRFIHRKGVSKAALANVACISQRTVRRMCWGVVCESKTTEPQAENLRTLHVISFLIAQRPFIGAKEHGRETT